MTTTVKIVIGIGAAGLLAAVIFYATKPGEVTEESAEEKRRKWLARIMAEPTNPTTYHQEPPPNSGFGPG